jgi:peroxiredoxin Q/BCP
VIKPGQRLDLDFPVTAVVGGERRAVRFRELLQRRTIVSVHMKNNTPGCERQTSALAEHAAAFAGAGYDLMAVSRDSAGSQQRLAARKGMMFAVVSDPEDRFAQAAGSLVAKMLYGRRYVGPARAAFVIERDGTVLAVVEKVDTADHAGQLRRVIEAIPGA